MDRATEVTSADVLSARQAAERLSEIGVSRRHAVHALQAGLAGVPIRTRGSLLYDARRVESLATRESLTEEQVAAACPRGLVVARRYVAVDEWERQAETLAPHWPLSIATYLWILVCLDADGFVPLVATVAGFVVTGAEITAVQGEYVRNRTQHCRWTLRPPGPWFAPTFETRRLATTAGAPMVIIGGTISSRSVMRGARTAEAATDRS